MNILIINHYAGSADLGMEYRPYYFAKEWMKMGHKVTIAAASFSHLRATNPIVKDKIETQNIDGIEYKWIKTAAYKGNGIGRIFNILSFLKTMWFNTSQFMNGFDAVIASSTYPLDIFVAKRIARRNKAKLIFEVHDLWPLTPIELGGFSRWHPYIMWLQYAENFAYKNSNAVVSLLPNTLEYMKQHGMHPSKWHYVPNGVCLEENTLPVPQDLLSFLQKLKDDEKFIVGYVGGHALSNNLNILLEAAKKCNDSDIVFVLIGKGIEKEQLISRAKKEQLKNIYFFDSVNKRIVPNLLKQFDVLYNGMKNESLYRFGISPNKIFDYMFSGRPIIFSIHAFNNIIDDAGCGFVVKPESSAEILEAVKKVKSLSEEDRGRMGAKGKDYIIKFHSFEFLAEKFMNILKS